MKDGEYIVNGFVPIEIQPKLRDSQIAVIGKYRKKTQLSLLPL